MTVSNKPGHRGEREVSRKTIARGMPGDFRCTCGDYVCLLHTAHEAAGAAGTRHSLRPLFIEGHCLAKLGRLAPRERGVVSGFDVVARSAATKQSTLLYLRRQQWIASRSLSSGARSRDPLARNDGLGGGS